MKISSFSATLRNTEDISEVSNSEPTTRVVAESESLIPGVGTDSPRLRLRLSVFDVLVA